MFASSSVIEVIKRKKFLPNALLIFISALLLNGCASLFGLSYYDSTTYRNLTELKPVISDLYDSFASEAINEAQVSSVSLKLRQIYEYEKGKGDNNKETISQAQNIIKMFEKHVKDRRDDGKWNDTHLSNQKALIGAAFDTAITTENLKNKN